MARAPPEPPSPMATLIRGTRRPNKSLMFMAMASPCMVITDQVHACDETLCCKRNDMMQEMMARVPPEPPSPITTLLRGMRRPNISLMFMAMVSPCKATISQAMCDNQAFQRKENDGQDSCRAALANNHPDRGTRRQNISLMLMAMASPCTA